MGTLPKLCLNMIVKNESHIIVERLTDLIHKIHFDYYVICDTGSTDGTQELITSFFNSHCIKGELHQHEWSDFGTNRTMALQAAYGKSDYLFIFDADDEVCGNLIIPESLIYDKYNLKFGNNFVYYRPLLVNNQKKWRFIGVLHEYLATDEISTNESVIEGDYYIESGKTGSRSQDPDKYIKDAKLLVKAYDAAVVSNDYSLVCRYAFYAAQSFKDAGNEYNSVAIEWYERVLNLHNWAQEKYYACIMIGKLHSDNFTKFKYYLMSWEHDKERIEGVVLACELAMNNGLHSTVCSLYHQYKNYSIPQTEKLFMFSNLYNDHLKYYYSISAFYADKTEVGYNACKEIIENNIIEDELLDRVYKNLLFYKNHLYEECSLDLFHKLNDRMSLLNKNGKQVEPEFIELWDILCDKHNAVLTYPRKFTHTSTETPRIFLSFTTCKRLDLFKPTVYSILNQITDIHKVDYWFCVDDNSSDEDREQMKTLFPWMQFYMKTCEEKGHIKSMNIIYDKLVQLQPTYWIHIEDDFLFFEKISLETTIAKMEQLDDPSIQQLLFNKNYAETIDDYKIGGSLPTNVEDIVVHENKEGLYPYLNCHYWPHYSFRPSIIRAKTIIELGNFDSNNKFFEMDYARKYVAAGYKSAFFNKITNKHTGRLTTERNTDKPNSYALNNEQQFNDEHPYIKIINLEKRTDRKEKMQEMLYKHNIQHWEFIKAVDGNIITPTSEIAGLFHGNDFGNRKGVIGCALSHYNLWKSLLEDEHNDFYVVMEDDVEFVNNFHDRFVEIKGNMHTHEFMFLGYHMYSDNRREVESVYNQENVSIDIRSLNKALYIGGYFGYTINKIGAKKLIEYIDLHGIRHGIDYLNLVLDSLNSVECVPQLMFSEWNENGREIDSDIQNIYDGFHFEEFDKPGEDDQDYIFIKGMDQFDFDVNTNTYPLVRKKYMIHKNDAIAGFNTVGFTKSHILYLRPSPYFGENDGIYVKRSCLKELGYDIRTPPVNLDKVLMKYDPGMFCFIHSCNVSEIGLVILDRLLDILKSYGKIDSYHKIFIINVGNLIDETLYSKYKNMVVVNFSSNIGLYELKTINVLYYFSLLNPDSKVLYIHTKGILREDNQLIQDWVNMMMYFLVKQQNSCISHLETYDAIGCNYCVSPTIKPHFSGNYWWANTNYMQTLGTIQTTDRHDAEWWILTNPQHKFKCMYHSLVNHYEESYPKEKYEKIRVKMLCNWCTSKTLCDEWKNMCSEDYMWENIEITWEDFDIDYYVIINHPCTNDYFDKKKTIVFQMEPWVNDKTKKWGVKTWGIWAEPSESEFMAVIGRKTNTYNNVFWQMDIKLKELRALEYNKQNIMSCVTSNKYFDEGHIARIDFLHFLENKRDIPMHIFGNVSEMGFVHYQGEMASTKKGDGLIPYKYYFMVENNYEENFMTEKLWEPILCESLVFYYGCPNVNNYIDSKAFVQLDMNDFEKSYEIIKTAIQEDWWSQRIEFIKKEKDKLLGKMAFFPRLKEIIRANSVE
jgi:GR25 family glycosyltransferase involved in LPS biosynthesis